MVSCYRELPGGLSLTRTCISDPGCAGAELPPATPLPVPHPRQFMSAAQRQNAAAYAAAATAATAALGRGPVPLAPSSTGWRVRGASPSPGALARPVQARSAPACEGVSFAGTMLQRTALAPPCGMCLHGKGRLQRVCKSSQTLGLLAWSTHAIKLQGAHLPASGTRVCICGAGQGPPAHAGAGGGGRLGPPG